MDMYKEEGLREEISHVLHEYLNGHETPEDIENVFECLKDGDYDEGQIDRIIIETYDALDF